MPSHIFTRVGSWEESINSNKESAQRASDDEAKSHTSEARDQRLHALDYLEYAYLQSGQIARAKSIMDQMNSLPPVQGLTLTGDYAIAAIPARYAVELGKWDEAGALQVRTDAVPWAQAITWMAVGVGSARSGNLAKASQAEQALAALRDKAASMNEYWSKQIEVQRREVAAWIQYKNGKPTAAIAGMRDTAGLEESMDKDFVTPGAITPAREMLAELLALEKLPQDALTEYAAVLKIAPKRFNALYGAATAAGAAGNATLANQYLKQLTEVALGNERPELVDARKRLTAQAGSLSRP
jgi:tetratricopeptide (TPR) repeat protein